MQTDQEFSSVVQLPNFPGRSVVTRTQAPEDPRQATAQTIERMKQWAAARANSPQVVGATMQALMLSGPEQEDTSVAIHHWISTHCIFREDDPVLRRCLNLENELEMLIEPARLLTMRPPMGDCDCLTTLCMSMHLCAGIPIEPVSIKADPEEPDRDSHVYCQAVLETGNLVLDPAMGCKHHWPAGAEAPDYFDRQTWGVIQPQKPKGLQGYLGLGTCADGSPEFSDGTCAETPTTTSPSLDSLGIPIPAGTPAYSGVGPYPTTSGINWTSLATVLGADATQIARLATLPAGYTLNAAGQPVLVGSAAVTSLLSSPMVLLLGGGILLFALIGGKK